MEDNSQKPIQFALDSRSVRRRQRHLRLMDNDPPHTVQKLWKENWRGMRTDEELSPNVIRAPYGRHLGRETEWNEDKRRFVTRGRAKLMPIHGPPNWDQLWPKDRDMGTDHMYPHLAIHPLSNPQLMVLNQYSNRCDIYYFFNRLSAGASGTVWRVECRPKNNPAAEPEILACKVMKPKTLQLAASIRNMRLILMDLQIGMMLSWLTRDGQRQPNLIPYLDVITIPDQKTHFPFSAMLVLMPMCHGDLDKLISVFAPQFLPHPVIKRWISHISSALQFLHQRDIVHLDIKAENILVRFADPSLHIYRQTVQTHLNTMTFLLSDYGVSRMHLQSERGLSISRVGTDNYMSPELYALDGPHSQRIPIRTKPCDIFALGVTLFKCRSKALDWRNLTNTNGIERYIGPFTQFQNALSMPLEDRQFTLLVYRMCRNNPKQRLTIEQVVDHPYVTKEQEAQPEQAEQPNP